MSSRIAFMLVLSLLAGCANRPVASGANGAVDDAAVTALYRSVEEAGAEYRAGMAQLATADADAGRSAMAQAGARLRDGAARCVALAGCDVARVVATYDALLIERTQAQDNDGETFAALGEDATAAGEGNTGGATNGDADDKADSSLQGQVPEAERTATLLNGRELADIIAMKGPVKAALTEWLTWMRPNLISAWENYQYMRYRMWPEYEQAGLPEAILFGILAKESGGRVHAVSRAGASGPLQFMYATGLRYGLGQVGGFDTRFDPQLAARANVRYLNDRFGEFNHNLELALAAYNGGEGRVGRLYRASGGKGFWNRKVYAQLPPETRDYVAMVLAAAWLFLHPDRYGLQFPQVDAAPAMVKLESATSMNELAICLGNDGNRDGWFRPLRNLNPRYEAHTAIPAGTELQVPAVVLPLYRDRCVQGPQAALAKDLASARRANPPPVQVAAAVGRYTVRSGDTLASIARRNRCSSPKSLAAANAIRAPRYLIRPGQKLILSGCRGP